MSRSRFDVAAARRLADAYGMGPARFRAWEAEVARSVVDADFAAVEARILARGGEPLTFADLGEIRYAPQDCRCPACVGDLDPPVSSCHVCAGRRASEYAIGREPVCAACWAWALAFDAWDEPARVAADLARLRFEVDEDGSVHAVGALTPTGPLLAAAEAKARELFGKIPPSGEEVQSAPGSADTEGEGRPR